MSAPDLAFPAGPAAQPGPNLAATLQAHRQSAQNAEATVDALATQLSRAAAWAAGQQQWTEAFDWFDLAAAWAPDAAARSARRTAGAQAVAQAPANAAALWRILSRWQARGDNAGELWEIAAELLQRCGVRGRALAARLHASRLGGEPGNRHAAWETELAAHAARTQGRPHIIFYNVTNSGASAIDPILRELLHTDFEYDLLGTPDLSDVITPFLPGDVPFYHWTHDGPGPFAPLLAQGRCKALCLYRDPRDVIVSHAMDPSNAAAWGAKPPLQVLHELASTNFPRFFANTRQWLAMDPSRVFRFSFEEMKQDVPALVGRILAFLGLELDPARIREVCDRHSFERVAGRSRGSEGPSVRTGHLLRKGVSGDWRNHFDAELAATFLEHCGRYLVEWGYERDDAWAEELLAREFGPQPFPLLVDAPINGFHLVRHADRFHAVHGPARCARLAATPADTLARWAGEDRYFSSSSLRETRAWAAAHGPESPSPS